MLLKFIQLFKLIVSGALGYWHMNSKNSLYRSILLVLLVLSISACESATTGLIPKKLTFQKTRLPSHSDNVRIATFGGGSFWCVEEIFEEVKGVETVIAGYAGGKEKDPTFKQVQYGNTSHAECVQVYYDPKVVTYKDLLDIFFMAAHDPTQQNKQGPDEGQQFRSIVFYRTAAEKRSIASRINMIDESNSYPSPVVTQVKSFEEFFPAEEEQQDFCARNPDNLYIQGVTLPRVKSFRKKFKGYLKPQYE